MEQRGYRGITYMYHHVSNQVIVHWTGQNIDSKLKFITENFLLSMFKVADAGDVPTIASLAGSPPSAQDLSTADATRSSDSGNVSSHELGGERAQATDGNSSNNSCSTDIIPKTINPSSPRNTTDVYLCTQFVSPTLTADIDMAITGNGDRCRICQYKSTEQNIRSHIRQHFSRVFCACGLQSPNKDTIYRHQYGNRSSAGGTSTCDTAYEVDKSGYSRFVEFMGWKNPPPLDPCISPKNNAERKDLGREQESAAEQANEGATSSNAAAANGNSAVDIKPTAYAYVDYSIAATEEEKGEGAELTEDWHWGFSDAVDVTDENNSVKPTAVNECQEQRATDCTVMDHLPEQDWNPVIKIKDITTVDPDFRPSSASFSRSKNRTVQFVSPTLKDEIESLLVGNTDQCGLCQYKTSKKHIRQHVRQHFSKYFCCCRIQSTSRDTIYRHQMQNNYTCDTIYEVDETGYADFIKAVGWKNPPALLPRVPTMNGTGHRNRKNFRFCVMNSVTDSTSNYMKIETEDVVPKKRKRQRSSGRLSATPSTPGLDDSKLSTGTPGSPGSPDSSNTLDALFPSQTNTEHSAGQSPNNSSTIEPAQSTAA